MMIENLREVFLGLKPELELSTCTTHLLWGRGDGDAGMPSDLPHLSHHLVPATFALESPSTPQILAFLTLPKPKVTKLFVLFFFLAELCCL